MVHTYLAPLMRSVLAPLAMLLLPLSLPARVLAAPASHPVSATSIASVVPSLHDVTSVYGHGFKTLSSSVLTNKEVASAMKVSGGGASVSFLRGRITGYVRMFVRSTASHDVIMTAVNQYSSAGVLRPQLDASFTRKQKPIPGLTIHVSRLAGLGDEAFLMTVRNHTTTSHVLAFVRGRYAAMVAPGRSSTSNLVKLAQIEDQRIQSAG